jgi:hypothetical protein
MLALAGASYAGQSAPPGEMPQVVVYDNEDFLGDHAHVFGSMKDLGKLGNSISSMIILSGTWEFFDDEDFKGTKMHTIGPGQYADVTAHGLKNNSISSIRLAGPLGVLRLPGRIRQIQAIGFLLGLPLDGVRDPDHFAHGGVRVLHECGPEIRHARKGDDRLIGLPVRREPHFLGKGILLANKGAEILLHVGHHGLLLSHKPYVCTGGLMRVMSQEVDWHRIMCSTAGSMNQEQQSSPS